MNFFDTYDIARSTTPNIDASSREQPTLNEEVNQVIGQFGRFWGGFRKQSQHALETARKDFSGVVVQAQKELTKLTATTAEAETPRASTTSFSDEHGEGEATPPASANDNGGSSSSRSTEDSNTGGEEAGTSSLSSTFFSRLQTSLPPNIVTTIQDHIPESLRHASENVDLGQLRTTLVSDFERVQGVTRAQAEEYFYKSEALLREVVKEAGEALKDAVKVIPPEEQSSGAIMTGLLWDGNDLWTHESSGDGSSSSSSPPPPPPPSSSKRVTAAAVATRAEALLKRLKHDAAILRYDPEAEGRDFVMWRAKEVDVVDGGIEGSEWGDRIASAMVGEDGQALKEMEGNLVPREMTRSTFWLRYFFRTHEIRKEEEKRKALIQSGTTETEDEFSWEDEEDESGLGNKTRLSPGDDKKKARVNSSDSFDLVSAGSESVVGDKLEETEEEEESDWE